MCYSEVNYLTEVNYLSQKMKTIFQNKISQKKENCVKAIILIKCCSIISKRTVMCELDLVKLECVTVEISDVIESKIKHENNPKAVIF